MLKKDDNELVYEVVNGSISSFGILIERYQKTVFRIMFHMAGDVETAKDLSQNVFVRAFENLGKFNPERRFYSWLYKIAVNEAIDWNRRKHKTEGLEAAEKIPASVVDQTDHEDRRLLLHRELRRIAPEYRILILLKYFSGFSYDEMAVMTGSPTEKVRSRLYIARQQLRTGLITQGFFDHG
jgi:RNA polymerase sigma-70 factor, ECF subfamily